MAQIREDVIHTKLTAPSLPFGLIGRERLHARLDAHPARIILVSAPAGFGKTALILDWLARRRPPVAWLSIDAADNDPTRFFQHLGAALDGLPGKTAAAAGSLVRTLAQRSGVAGDVQAAFAALGPEPVVVLDDVHELEEPRVLAGLEQLLAVRAPAPRVVLLTRVDPPLALGRLRLSGELLELREHDLRFNGAECEALFDGLLPGALTPAVVAQLEQRTEGWAAGLRLAAIALHDVADPARAVAAFGGSHRLVVDYLVEEAVEKQSPAVQQFLMDTSILERFTPEACAAITGDADARTRLDEVEAANLFLVPLGGERRWYRYHHLFRELLHFRLQRLQPERVEVLHARAAAYFQAAGQGHEAIEHAGRLHDRTCLLELLDARAFEILASSELATFGRWVARLPDPLAEPYPQLIVAVGWLRMLTERAPDLERIFAAADAALARVGPHYDARRRAEARAQLDVLRGFAARFAGRLEEALLVSRAAQQDLSEDNLFARGLVSYNIARLETLIGRMDTAAERLRGSFVDNLRAGNTYVLLTGLGQTAAVRAQLEGVYRAREELNGTVAFAQQHHFTGLPAYAAILYHAAHLDYLADDLDAAQESARQAIELGRAGNFPEAFGNGLMLLARIAAARGRFAEAESILTEIAALMHSSNLVLLDSTLELEQFRLALARDPAGAVTAAPAAGAAPDAGGWTTVQETRVALCLRSALRREDYDAVRPLAELLLRESEPRGRGIAATLALAAQALLPDQQERWPLLDRALRTAAARGYIRALVELGDVLRPALEACPARGLSAEARACARLVLDRLATPAANGPDVARPALLEPLTAREQDVLRYLCDGLSNKAIARTMYVSVETVKTHLKHVYWKLGTSTRAATVARASELGLASRLPA